MPAGEKLSARARKQPARFSATDMKLSTAELNYFDRTTGARKDRQPERPCPRADCAATRAELAAALQLSEERLVAQHLAEEELRRARAQCGGAEEMEAAGYLQQAALQMLDGREEAKARLRLLPGGRVQLDVLVHADDDGEAEMVDAAADDELSDTTPAPPPQC